MQSYQFSLLAIFFHGISSTTLSYLWTIDSLWTDKLTAVSPSWTLQQVTLTKCSMICLNQAYCVSFFYNNQTLQCQGHNNQLTDTAGSTPETGWSYYTVTCQGGFGYIYVREFNTCYKIFLQTLPWDDANNICIGDGGNMINLPDINKYNFFVNLLKSDPDYNTKFWLGLTDKAVEGTYLWQDGTEMNSSDPIWELGQPDDGNGQQDCVQLTVSSGKFDDFTCTGIRSFICEGPSV